ncbi:MmcQ/YjbR family DNA-binding protein [Pontibacter qinzhouensis]|uniref:MmcQ/YjbR family DNA-binding protein n=1 Tax=Pontibacter qinzhouensis TaxID=2603253 RepID=UPI002105254A|nr:MmcQ/YjbR family DNA-binding protein [Pontibacter qinzhouensis]
MTLEQVEHLCQQLPGVTQDIKWEKDLCFCVAEKMFLVLGFEENPITGSFKVPDEEFDAFCEREGFAPAPYLARYKWVAFDNLNRLQQQEWQQCINKSYNLVRAKLPKKKQQELERIS